MGIVGKEGLKLFYMLNLNNDFEQIYEFMIYIHQILNSGNQLKIINYPELRPSFRISILRRLVLKKEYYFNFQTKKKQINYIFKKN